MESIHHVGYAIILLLFNYSKLKILFITQLSVLLPKSYSINSALT